MQVFLFGAGASHSYSLSKTGVRPPLAKSFFEVFNQLELVNDPYVLVGNIVIYVRDTRGIDPMNFADWNENIEDFLTEIDERIGTREAALRLDITDRGHYSQAYQEMVFLFTSVLNEIQNGPPCPNYSALVRRLNPEDALITFNWDTLLDRVLWESGRWSPADGYGVDFKGFFDDGWRDDIPRGTSKNKLLKLHGSTNWLMPFFTLDLMEGERVFINRTVDPSSRPIFCFVKAEHEYATYRNRSRAGYEPFSYYYYPPDIPIVNRKTEGWVNVGILNNILSPEHTQVTRGGQPFASMPLLIPPVRHKEYSLLGDTLDNIWRHASDALSRCDRLTIIGYSFPVTDIRAWQLIEGAVTDRPSPLDILVIDPYPEQLVQRLRDNLRGKCNVNYYKGAFSDYISTMAEV